SSDVCSSDLLVAIGLQYRKFGIRWLAFRRHDRIFKKAAGPAVLIEHDVPVQPFEVERISERFAHGGILKFLAPEIEGVTLHTGGALIVDLLADDKPFADRGEVIAGCPVLGAVLRAIVIFTGGERLEPDRRVAIEIIADGVEIIAPFIDGDIR